MIADTSTNSGGVAAGSPSVVGGGSGGALDPNVIPQWKKELIQRRKNLAKTIGAVATQVHDSASTVAAAISASASSPVLTHPRTPTGGFPVGSPFYAGTKENQPTNTSTPLDGTVPDSETEHDSHGTAVQTIDSSNDSLPPSVNAHTAAAAVTSPTTAPGSFMGVHFAANEHLQQQQQQHHQHQQQARGVGSSSVGVLRASEAVAVVVQPSSSASGSSPTSVPTANGAHSHSNAGSEHSGSSAAIATNRTGSSGTNSSVIVERESSSTVCSSGGPGTHTTSGIGSGSSSSSSSSSTSVKSLVSGANGSAQQQQHGNAREGGVAARKMVAATAAEEIVVVYEKSSVLGGLADATGGGGGGIGVGGVGAGGITALGDAGEELKYGPGIVSRLRCRYLSLALRQSVAKQRPSLNSMRRATSLNNLLDEESEDLSEREQSIGSEGTGHGGGPQQQQQQQQQQQKKYQSQNYHYQHHQQQQQQHREQYANGNGNNHNHNHQQQQLHPTVVLQPPYQKQPQHHFAPKQQPWIQQQLHKEEESGGGAVKTAPFLRGVQNSYTRASRQVEKKNEYNRYTKHHRGAGGADAVLLKRARSVEALVRYDHKAWERDGVSPVVGPAAAAAAAAVTTTAAAAAVAAAPTPAVLAVSPTAEVGSNVIILDEIAQAPTTAQATVLPAGGGSEGHATTNGISSSVSPTVTMLMNGGKGGGAAGGGAAATPTELPLLVSDCVTIEEKIINGREKGDPKPKRLTSIIDADERPPPDVVKQTMKIFEANANRRGGRGVNGSTNGGSDVATKVASYRSIIISGSATAGATTAAAAVGPGEKPPITHPKPPLSPKKPNIMPRTASPKQQQQPNQVTAAKPPPTPKSLEAVNNLKNAPATAAAAPIGIVKNNNKAPIGGGGGGATSESTPPSPPARSKHTAAAAAAAAAALNGVGVGVAVSKNMQSNGGDDDDGTQSADPMADAKTTNALKNGVGTVRDHHQHHDSSSSSNGTTQTAAAVTPSAKQSAPGSDGGNGGSGHQHKHNGNTALEAAAVPSAASSPTTGICDSPSIQQLTTKLGSLHLATSTPTGAANGSAVSVQDRRNLEYVTSDEEEEEDDDDEDVEEGEGDNVDGENERGRRNNSSRSYQVNPESSESEDARDGAASGGSENDADDDEEAELDDDDERSVRKISRTAMENIARAGTTTQFRFNGAVKSYLPGGAMGKPAAPAPSTKAPAPPIPMSRESLAGKANGASTAAAAAVQAIEVSGRLPPEGAANNSVNGVGGVGGGGSAKQHSSGSTGALLQQGGGGSVGSSTAPSAPSLTRREIEKNQINREKSGEPAVPAAAASSGTNSINGSVASGGGVQVASANNNNNNANNANPSGASGGGGGAKQTSAVDSTTSFVAKWGTGGVVGTGVAAVAGQSSPLAGLVPVRKKTKPPPSHQQEGTNTMVFNFSDRKDVPDYIENDGVIIRPRPRELPKPGESGFVVLGDLTLETSTDPDDAWAAGPPSPCNGEFANAYIVINGKSSMRNKTSRSNNKFKIQFDDSLTSTYEYPSETSLLEETNGFDGVDNGTDTNGASAFADNGLLSHTNKLLSSVPLGSAPFASYTPVKAAIDTTFELGVTRTPSPSAASTASSTGSNGSLTSASNHSSNSHHSATSASSSGSSEKKQHLPHTVPNGHHHPVDRSNSNGLHSSNGHSGSPDGGATLLLNGGTGAADGDALFNGATGEPESIQYLKPASDEQTVNWSQGTRVTDLLF